MKEKILSYGRQWINDDDIQAVVETLKGGFLTQGPLVGEFEKKLAAQAGAKYAVVANSATSCLHIAVLAAGITQGDEVITSPITFVASSNAAFYCGATPVFVDVEKETAIIDVNLLRSKVNSNTRAIIPVHFAGQSADMKRINQIAQEATRRYGKKVYVIEDAAHGLGGTYGDKPIGSCEYSDMAVYSFHPVKHITTCEGGAVLTNDDELYRLLTMYRSHGITRDPKVIEDSSTAPWGYEQHVLGFNYRLPDVQCALGISQLKRLPQFVSRRREIAQMYRKAFSEFGDVGFLEDNDLGNHAFHLFVVLLPYEKLGGRSQVMMKLRERGLVTQVHYIPVHTQPYYKKNLGTKFGDFPNAEDYYKSCLSIPMFPAMTDEDVHRVVGEIKDLFN